MNWKYPFQSLVVAVYITMTVAGMTYTLFRYEIPGVPRAIKQFSYGMMAPYQTYLTHNEELVAEGRTAEGDWERINLHAYLPYIRGERSMRAFIVTFRVQGEEVWQAKYREYARLVQSLEADRGRRWQSVRLFLEKWPMSPGGYEFLRQIPFTETFPVAQIP